MKLKKTLSLVLCLFILSTTILPFLEKDRIYTINAASMGVGLEWEFETADWTVATPSVVDLDDDGYLETIIGSNDDKVYCLDYEGNEIWNFTTSDNIGQSTAIVADLEGDGEVEILIGNYDGIRVSEECI